MPQGVVLPAVYKCSFPGSVIVLSDSAAVYPNVCMLRERQGAEGGFARRTSSFLGVVAMPQLALLISGMRPVSIGPFSRIRWL